MYNSSSIIVNQNLDSKNTKQVKLELFKLLIDNKNLFKRYTSKNPDINFARCPSHTEVRELFLKKVVGKVEILVGLAEDSQFSSTLTF